MRRRCHRQDYLRRLRAQHTRPGSNPRVPHGRMAQTALSFCLCVLAFILMFLLLAVSSKMVNSKWHNLLGRVSSIGMWRQEHQWAGPSDSPPYTQLHFLLMAVTSSQAPPVG